MRCWDPLTRREGRGADLHYPIHATSVLDEALTVAIDKGILAIDL